MSGAGDPSWQGCDSILIACGKNDGIPFKKNNTLHLWLFGVQLLSTIMIITPQTIHICCSKRTREALSQVGNSNKNGDLTLNFIIKNKDDSYQSNYTQLIDILKTTNNGKLIAFINENQIGKFIKNFLHLIGADNNGNNNKDDKKSDENNGDSKNGASNRFQFVDFGLPLSHLTMIKDNHEQMVMKRVGNFLSTMFVYCRNRIEKCVERDSTKKHSEIMEDIIQFMDNGDKFDKVFNKGQSNGSGSYANFKKDNLDVAYNPVIQSGGKFKLKIKGTSESDNEPLYYNGGCVVIMIGFKLKDYCVNVGRTLYFDATKEQKEIYQVLLKAFKKGLITLRNNVQLSNVYNAALKVVKTKMPELEKNFMKNVGWGVEYFFI